MSQISEQPSSPDPVAGQSPPSNAFTGGVFALALAGAVVTTVILIRHGAETHWPLLLWAIACTLTALGFGMFSLAPATRRSTLTPAERTRFAMLLLGGLLGLWTALIGFVLPFT